MTPFVLPRLSSRAVVQEVRNVIGIPSSCDRDGGEVGDDDHDVVTALGADVYLDYTKEPAEAGVSPNNDKDAIL